ncbi:MAG: hypothetical protein ACYTGF_17385 [Planctomycetota bacterium]|jgi:hypothetical protein
MFRRFVPSRRSLRAFAVAGAWFFVVISLAHLVWVIGAKWGDPAGATKLYHAIVDGRSHDAWGLTYTDTFGLITAIFQFLVVTAAAAVTVLPWPRRLRFRRLGHGILCSWAALWAVNLLWLASIDHSPATIAQATLLCLLAGCTGYRATMGWSPGRSPTPPPAPTLDEDDSDKEPAPPPRFMAYVAAARSRTAAGLDRVGDFAHKQAQRLAQTR